MKLFFREFGERGKPRLLLLHGLLGSSRNWVSVGKKLGDSFHVAALDLRNHGASPHSDNADYEAMVGDVIEWMDVQKWNIGHLMGHSMGGKTAMHLTSRHPEKVDRLIVVDIAPKDNPPYNAPVFRILNGFPLETIATRKEAESLLAEKIDSWPLRQFLLTNLAKKKEGGFYWQINLSGLTQALPNLSRNPLSREACDERPALFIKGGRSSFIREEDFETIRRHYPNASIRILENAGHNPHIENQAAFLKVVREFLAEA